VIGDFQVSTTLGISPLSLYAAGLGVGALFASAASEVWGRTIIYRVSLPIALVFTIVGGAATEFRVLAVSRTLAAFFGSPATTIGAGVLNDMWDIKNEKIGSLAAVLFIMQIIWATQVGAMMGASIVVGHNDDWRWTFWLTAIILGISTLLTFVIPETYEPEILRRRARKLKIPLPSRGEFVTLFLVAVGRPLHMMVTEPIVFPISLVLAVFQAVLTCYYIAYAQIFEGVYQFTPYQVGMAFGPLLVGAVIALPLISIIDKFTYQRALAESVRLGTEVSPEERLYPTMLGAILLPASLFW
jgi:MFS family permease